MKKGKVEGTVKNKHLILRKPKFLKFYKKPQQWFRSLVLISIFVFLQLAFNPNPAAAASFYWKGGHAGTPNAWNDALNWSASSGGGGGAGVPGSSDTAIFDSGSAVNCTLTAGVVVGSITNSNYTRILALSTYALTVNGDLTWNAGTISAGSSIITVAGNLSTTGSTFTYSTSTIVMTGTAKTITNGSTAYYNLTISGNVSTASSDLVILNNLTVDTNKVLSIANSQKVTLGPDLTLTLNGTIDGDGTLYFAGWSSKTLPATGTLNVDVEINESTVSIPGRDFGKDLSITASSTSTTNLGTASGQTINIAGNFTVDNVIAGPISDYIINANTNNPNINISGYLKSEYSGACSSHITWNAGNGTWTIGDDLLICGTLNAGNSTFAMVGSSSPILYTKKATGDLTFYNLTIDAVATHWGYGEAAISHHLEIMNSAELNEANTSIRMLNGSSVTNNGKFKGDTTSYLIFSDFVLAPVIAGSGDYDIQIIFYLSSISETYITARTYTNRVWFQGATVGTKTFHLGSDNGQTIQFRDIIVDSLSSGNVYLDASPYNPNVTVTDDIETHKFYSSYGQGYVKMGSGTWTLNQRMNIAAEQIDQQTATVVYQKIFPTQTRIGSINGSSQNTKSSTIYNGKIVIGGVFATVNNVAMPNVASYDPTAGWQAMGDGLDSWVNAVLTKDNKVYACGYFNNSGSTPMNAIAKWDGASWSAAGTNMTSNDYCEKLVVIDDRLYAVGYFSSFSNDIICYDPATDSWQEFTTDPSKYIRESGYPALNLLSFQNKIYIVGGFDSPAEFQGGSVVTWDGLNWTVQKDIFMGDSVNAAIVYNNKLVVGGDFSSVNGVNSYLVASWDGSNWSNDMNLIDNYPTSYATGQPYVNEFATYNDDLVTFGNFSPSYGTIDGVNNLAIWQSGVWQQLRNQNFWVSSAMQYCNDLLIGGWDDSTSRSPVYLYSPDGEPIQYCEAGGVTPTPTPTAEPALTSTPASNPALTSTPAPTGSSTTGAASTSGSLSDILPATGKSTPDRSYNLFRKIELFILEKITLQFHY